MGFPWRSLESVQQEILSLPGSCVGTGRDQFVGGPFANEQFGIKSAYNLICEVGAHAVLARIGIGFEK